MTDQAIRAATVDDLDRIKEIAVAAGMFSSEEAEFFDDLIPGALDGSLEDHQWLVVENTNENGPPTTVASRQPRSPNLKTPSTQRSSLDALPTKADRSGGKPI